MLELFQFSSFAFDFALHKPIVLLDDATSFYAEIIHSISYQIRINDHKGMKHMSFYTQNLNLFNLLFEKMKGILFLCMTKGEEIPNAATQKSCEQTVMDDEMQRCANSNYSLRTSFDSIYVKSKTWIQS